MAKKSIVIENIGQVALYKRRGTRHIRLSIAHNGEVRVSLPAWAPYQAGIDFVRTKADWISSVRRPKVLLGNGQMIGKTYRLVFAHGSQNRITTRLKQNIIYISLPVAVSPESASAQLAAERAVMRALRREAEDMLPYRLAQTAEKHGFTYKSVQIRKLKGRWGSCSEKRDIVLNFYLMTLPWELIDYVLIHELVHTRIFAHGKPFWGEVGQYVVDLPRLRKTIRTHKPSL